MTTNQKTALKLTLLAALFFALVIVRQVIIDG
jgi:hypothetical protein